MIRRALIVNILLYAAIVRADFRAGAGAVDITPEKYPVVVNAMFTERTASRAVDSLFSRAIVLDDGSTRLAMVVVDTCMLPRELIDAAKRLAHPFPPDRILISATHTHSAPSAMGCLGSRADPVYARALPAKIAESITLAAKALQPARIGWDVVQAPDLTFNRRWIRRPDRVDLDPFGNRTVRANMHPGHESSDVVGPSGPVDPDLSIISVQTPDGRPLALLANYSMHYYGSPLLSSDYFGAFSEEVARLLGASRSFVAAMSQGTSGDLMWMDYSKPREEVGYKAYAHIIARRVFDACQRIQHRDQISLAMAEARMRLRYRVAAERLGWAKEVAMQLGDRLPQKLSEIYALEALHLHQRQSTELILQALRIGDLGITAIPNEVFAITGLKIKAQSPLQPTFNIELANGAEGYIPPPEQHKLGGYTTWPARTAGLEVEAEPRIVEQLLRLLESVSRKERRGIPQLTDVRVLQSKPVAYWPLSDFSGPFAKNAIAEAADARFEGGVAFYLEGRVNQAVHFAGGRLKANTLLPDEHYSAEMWLWNGMPNDARPVTGYFFSRGAETNGEHLAIGGTHTAPGKLIFFDGQNVLAGSRVIPLRTWTHVALVREQDAIRVYFNGQLEISGTAPVTEASEAFIGGRSDNFANFEGRIDEVALYERALTDDEIARRGKIP